MDNGKYIRTWIRTFLIIHMVFEFSLALFLFANNFVKDGCFTIAIVCLDGFALTYINQMIKKHK